MSCPQLSTVASVHGEILQFIHLFCWHNHENVRMSSIKNPDNNFKSNSLKLWLNNFKIIPVIFQLWDAQKYVWSPQAIGLSSNSYTDETIVTILKIQKTISRVTLKIYDWIISQIITVILTYPDHMSPYFNCELPKDIHSLLRQSGYHIIPTLIFMKQSWQYQRSRK